MADDLKLPKGRIIKADASIWKRILAFVTDFLIVRIIILSPFTSIIQQKLPVIQDFGAYFEYLQTNEQLMQSLTPILLAMGALTFAYFVIFEWKMKQTPGKMIFKLYAEPEKGAKMTLWRIMLRNLFAFPIGPVMLLWIIDPIYVITAKKRLTEIISKTKTVEEVAV